MAVKQTNPGEGDIIFCVGRTRSLTLPPGLPYVMYALGREYSVPAVNGRKHKMLLFFTHTQTTFNPNLSVDELVRALSFPPLVRKLARHVQGNAFYDRGSTFGLTSFPARRHSSTHSELKSLPYTNFKCFSPQIYAWDKFLRGQPEIVDMSLFTTMEILCYLYTYDMGVFRQVVLLFPPPPIFVPLTISIEPLERGTSVQQIGARLS